MKKEPLEVVSLSKKEFDNQRVKPDNVLFFVYEEYVSEDKKAKVRIRLYKGPHLICGDLYEAVTQINKEIEKLKGNGGTGNGNPDLFFSAYPRIEDYRNNGYYLIRVSMYPERYHYIFDGIPAQQYSISQVIDLSEVNVDRHYTPSLYLLVEDNQPIDKGILDKESVKLADCKPYLYKIGYGQSISIDYKQIDRKWCGVVNGGTTVINNINDGHYISFYFNRDSFFDEDKMYIYPCYDKYDWGSVKLASFSFNQEDVTLAQDGHGMIMHEGKESVIGALEFHSYVPTDNLGRFFIALTMDQSVFQIDFLSMVSGEQKIVYSLELTDSTTHIDIAPYGIYLYQRDDRTIVKDFKNLSFNKIHFHYKDKIGDRIIRPAFCIMGGSCLDYGALEL